jgi:hypothetical protein
MKEGRGVERASEVRPTVYRGVRLFRNIHSNPGLTNPNAQGLGLLTYTPRPPEASGTISMGVATPHKGVRVALTRA